MSNLLTFDQLPAAVSMQMEMLKEIKEMMSEALQTRKAQVSNIEHPIKLKQAAQLLGLSEKTVRKYAMRREIKSTKKGRTLFFYESELLEWVNSGKRKSK